MSYLTKRFLIAVGMAVAIFVGLGFGLVNAYSNKTEEPVIAQTTVSPYVKFFNPLLDKMYIEAAALQKEKEELINKQVSSSLLARKTVAVENRSEGSDCEQYRPLIASYDWPVETAMAICNAESDGSPAAVNMRDSHSSCVGSFGLFQNACFWASTFGYTTSDLLDPGINIKVAYRIWKSQGFHPWTTYRKMTSI